MKKLACVVITTVFIVILNFKFNEKLEIRIFDEKNVDFIKGINNRDNKSYDKPEIDNFKNIKIQDSVELVISKIGNPARIDESEYGFNWYVYNQYSKKFAMVGIENGKVAALYSNSIDSCENLGINLNSNQDLVRKKFSPIEYRKKGNIKYIINSQNQYDIINKDNKYITIFYDIYENNIVCSYQIISSDIEEKFDGIYPKESETLERCFELEVMDLTNSVRQKRRLNSLSYSEKASESSKKHSLDMKVKNFFNHINKNNETPFDRMKKEGIVYMSAGENIAAGQTSAIYVHEAWMNSQGHRKNILGEYKDIGVGVVFGGYYKTYYTQNFYM